MSGDRPDSEIPMYSGVGQAGGAGRVAVQPWSGQAHRHAEIVAEEVLGEAGGVVRAAPRRDHDVTAAPDQLSGGGGRRQARGGPGGQDGALLGDLVTRAANS